MAAGVGRICIGGKDAGAAIALGTRTVVTAAHVLGRGAALPVEYRPSGGGGIPASEMQVDEALDAAALRLADDVGEWLPVAAAVEGTDWLADSPPPGNDPSLTGRVTKVGLLMENTEGMTLDVLQLQVDQLLGDYRGYSGSGVLDWQGRAVVGLLVEQKHLRLPTEPGGRRLASNVLYAVPIRAVVERFGLTVAAARPRRLSVDAVLPGSVTRNDLLDRLVQKLIGAAPGQVVRIWGLGGMGKTTLVRQAVQDPRVWQAFPGGIVMVTARGDAGGHEVLADLASTLGVFGLEARDALAGDSTLVVVDDVWSSELVDEIVDRLPDNVVLAVTSRGTQLEEAQLGRIVESLRVGEMLPGEAVGLLGRGVRRSAELDRALGELASVLGHWPLLLALAASEIHGDELHADDEQGLEPLLGSDAVAANARQLTPAFARDPTKLDDPDSQSRSFARMIERSLARVAPESRERFMQLAIYPAGADLMLPVLVDLWQVDELDGRRTVRGLRRVGLVNVVSSDPVTVRLHDQIVAWLHHMWGAPEAAAHHLTHRRLAALALGAHGEPGPLTVHRVGWVAFHLCRTGLASDPGRLLEEQWSSSYLKASGSRGMYLAALREIVGHWGKAADGEPPASSQDEAARSIVLAGLLHAFHAAVFEHVPAEALIAEALLGRSEAAMRQAIDDPQQWRASATLVDIVGALTRRGALTPPLIVLASELVERLRNNVAQAGALTGLSSVLARSQPEVAYRLWERALGLEGRIQYKGDRASILASLAVAEQDRDPSEASRLLEKAVEVAEQVSDPRARDGKLREVAAAMVHFDADRASELVARMRDPDAAGLARAMAARNPERAAELAEQISIPVLDRDEVLAWMAGLARALSSTDPVRATALADQLVDDGDRGWMLATVARELTESDPKRARDLIGRAVELAEGIRYEAVRSRIFAAAAVAMADIDPEQAQVLLDRALELAERGEVRYVDGPARVVSAVLRCAPAELERVSDTWLPYDGLGDVAARMAVTDPGRARRLLDRAAARAEGRAAEPYGLPLGLFADVGAAMAAFDPRRAAALLWRAVEGVEQLPEGWRKTTESGNVAAAMAGADWPGARPFLERAARRVMQTAGRERDYALGQIGGALAHSDPAWAVELASLAADDVERSRAVTKVAVAVIATDHAGGRRLLLQAAELAESTAEGLGRDLALQEVAGPMLRVDPARAITLAEQISNDVRRMETLAELATAVLDSDPEQAAAIAARILDAARHEQIGGAMALIDHRSRQGKAEARLAAALGLVWWDLEATLWFVAGWLETTYPTPTPPAAITGRAIVDMMSRFFPLPLRPQT